jgi:ABC-type nitrate/sulfonate/bicarbonate transport system permease component
MSTPRALRTTTVSRASDGTTARASRKRRAKTTSSLERWVSILSPVFFLSLWEIAARSGLMDARFFPPPTAIASTFLDMIQSGELARHTQASLRRVMLGFLLGGIPAILLGLAMGLYRPVRAALEPLVAATYPIPKSALVPLSLLIFGLGEMSKIAIVAIGVFFPLLINTLAGVANIDKLHHEVGQTYGASGWQKFTTIAFPGALPLILTGVQLGIGMGLVLIAIAEMIGARDGLGFLIWNSWQVFAVEQMYVGLVVIGVLGIVLTAVLRVLERFIVPWRVQR